MNIDIIKNIKEEKQKIINQKWVGFKELKKILEPDEAGILYCPKNDKYLVIIFSNDYKLIEIWDDGVVYLMKPTAKYKFIKKIKKVRVE